MQFYPDSAALSAAMNALAPLIHDDDISVTDGVLACLSAFKAARSAKARESAALLLTHTECSYVDGLYDLELTDIVCSAMFAMLFNLRAEDMSPLSVGGSKIAILIKSAKVLESMAQIESAFDDYSDIFGVYLADEAVMLADAAINGKLPSAKSED